MCLKKCISTTLSFKTENDEKIYIFTNIWNSTLIVFEIIFFDVYSFELLKFRKKYFNEKIWKQITFKLIVKDVDQVILHRTITHTYDLCT